MTILAKTYTQTVSQKEQIIPVAWLKQTPNQANFASNGDVMISHSDGRLSQYIISLLNHAQNDIVICSFLLAHKNIEDAIFQASERGVRVYLMMACEQRLEKTSDDEFGQKCEEQHRQMLKRLAGKVLIRSAPHYHAKAVLIDALGENNHNAKGVLLTANITHEALERNEELAVTLPRQAIDELVQFFRWGFFSEAQHQMLNNSKFESIAKKDIEYPRNSKVMCFTSSQENSILDNALKMIEHARQEIIVSSFGFDENHLFIQRLCEKAKQGILVKVLTRIRPSNMSALMQLQQAGASIYGFKWLHAKAIWVDGQSAMVMSANLQQHGLDEGFEIGIRLDGQTIQSLKSCLDYFMGVAQHHLVQNLPVGNCLGELKLWENNQFIDLNIQPERKENLPDETADCTSDLSKNISLPKSDWRKNPVQTMIYQYQVIAPTLPSNTKELFWEEKKPKPIDKQDEKDGKKAKPEFDTIKHSYQPQVFVNKGQHYIAISGQNELNAAIELRNKQFQDAKIVIKIEKK